MLETECGHATHKDMTARTATADVHTDMILLLTGGYNVYGTDTVLDFAHGRDVTGQDGPIGDHFDESGSVHMASPLDILRTTLERPFTYAPTMESHSNRCNPGQGNGRIGAGRGRGEVRGASSMGKVRFSIGKPSPTRRARGSRGWEESSSETKERPSAWAATYRGTCYGG